MLRERVEKGTGEMEEGREEGENDSVYVTVEEIRGRGGR